MFNWLQRNKEWVFSGIGVFVMTLFVTAYFNGQTSQAKKNSDNTQQSQDGNGNVQVNNQGEGTVLINPPTKHEKSHILENSLAGITLVKTIPGRKNLTDKSTHVCKAISGTSIKLLGEPLQKSASSEWQEIEIKDGQCKGKTGWVSTENIRYK